MNVICKRNDRERTNETYDYVESKAERYSSSTTTPTKADTYH